VEPKAIIKAIFSFSEFGNKLARLSYTGYLKEEVRLSRCSAGFGGPEGLQGRLKNYKGVEGWESGW